MRRRAFLSGFVGSMAILSGCSTDAPTENSTFQEVFNPTGQAVTRQIDEPLTQGGITSESEAYLFGQLFHPGDGAPVVDSADATWIAEKIDGLSSDEFAVLTNLRTSSDVPAYFWPKPAGHTWTDDGLQIQLERDTFSTTVESTEAVGVALTVFKYTGEQPRDVSLVFPGGATQLIGT